MNMVGNTKKIKKVIFFIDTREFFGYTRLY